MPLNNGMSDGIITQGIGTMETTKTHNFHVPLSDKLNRELRAEAKRTGRPATELAREAIEHLVEDRKREAIHREIATYARAIAGSPEDLDSELEAASIEHLRDYEDSTS